MGNIMETKDKIKYGLWFLSIVLGFAIAITFIRNIKYTSDEDYKEKLADRDSIISAIKGERAAQKMLLNQKDENISELKRNDSLIAIKYNKGIQIHKSNNDKLNQIPSHIQSIADNDDSLYVQLYLSTQDN